VPGGVRHGIKLSGSAAHPHTGFVRRPLDGSLHSFSCYVLHVCDILCYVGGAILEALIMLYLKALVLAALAAPSLGQLNEQTTPTLNLTAIGASHGESTLECWQLDSPFKTSTGAGTSGALGLFLGDLSNATYTVLPGRFDGGLHTAPARQYANTPTPTRSVRADTDTSRFVLFTTGLIHITLPNGTDEAWIQGGKYGLIIAADTADVSTHGHRTQYPSAADTIGIQFPIQSGSDFKYKRLHRGACHETEMTGL